MERKIAEMSQKISTLDEELQNLKDKEQEQNTYWKNEHERLIDENKKYTSELKAKLEDTAKKASELEEVSEALMQNIKSASEREICLSRDHEQLLSKVKCYQKILSQIQK